MTAEALALPNGTTMDEPTQSVNDRKKRRSRAGTLVAIIVVALGVVAWWWLGRGRVSTDNAFIQADIVQLSPRINGTVAEVLVDENDWVEAGQPLLRLDPVDYDVQVDQARAAVATARAQLETAAADLDLTREQSEAGVLQAEAVLRAAQSEASRAAKDAQRYRDLLAKDEIARQQVDQIETMAQSAREQVEQARASLRQARTAPQQVAAKQAQVSAAQAQLEQAEATLRQAELEQSYCEIRAPRAGRVTRKNVLAGQQVAVGKPMLALVSNEPWVIANFKETQLTDMRPGQTASFEIDAYPDYEFRGYVESIQAGTGSIFSLLPPENATGNYVKGVQRVPVKLVFDPKPDEAHRLVPGMSVVPTVDVARAPRELPRQSGP